MSPATAAPPKRKTHKTGHPTITCNVQGLVRALGLASAVAPKRSPKPIIQNVLLVADPETGSELVATDLEIGVRVRCLGVTAENPCAVLLEPVRLSQILRTSTDEEMMLSIEPDGVHVLGQTSRFRLSTEDPNAFPHVPSFDPTDHLVVAPGDLMRGIDRTLFACDLESTRYALGGVLFEPGRDDQTLTMVATDGRRLARQTISIERERSEPASSAAPHGAVVPQKALKLLRRSLAGDEPPVHMALTGAAVLARTDHITLWSRLVEGRFPRYQDVFPDGFASTTTLPAGLLRGGFAQAAITTSEESRGITCGFSAEQLLLESSAADLGSARIEIPITLTGEPVTLCLDGRLALQMLGTLDGERPVKIEINDPKSAVVLRTEDGLTLVQMPLTRDA